MISKFKLEGEDREALAILHARASWFILECKYLYYECNASPVEDVVYDQIEKLYEALCVHLGVQPTATDMVGFDRSRPSCEMVATKSQCDPVPRSVELMEFVQVLADTVDAEDQSCDTGFVRETTVCDSSLTTSGASTDPARSTESSSETP